MLLGNYNVGKTSMIYQFINEQNITEKNLTLGLDHFILKFKQKDEIF